MNRTEKLEQLEIEKALQHERELEPSKYLLPDSEALPPQSLGQVILENTVAYNKEYGWCDQGTYIDGSW